MLDDYDLVLKAAYFPNRQDELLKNRSNLENIIKQIEETE